MGNKTNYSRMSIETKADEISKVEDITEQDVPVVNDEPEDDEPAEIIGTVIDCIRLNIRKEPNQNAMIDGTIERGDSVIIYEEIGDFYRIGVDQYCMKKFIEIDK